MGQSPGSNESFALENVNIEVLKGQKIAIIGNNGSGKTTLLKLISGLYQPTKGEVYLDGEAILLRGMGIGMADQLSVGENIFLYGVIYGMDRGKIKEKFEDIVKWTELEGFVDAELRTLSSGMRTRLALSVSRHFDTDIFLLDEAFVGGDKHFKEKYQAVFKTHLNGHRTFMIATHDLDLARSFCTKALWLNKGQQMAFGDIEKVLGQYMAVNSD